MEQLRLAAQASEGSLRQLPFVGAGVLLVLTPWADPFLLFASYGAMCLAAALVSWIIRPIAGGNTAPDGLKAATLRFAAVDFAFMLLFASFIPIGWVEGEPVPQALVLVVAAATMATTASVTGPHKLIWLADLLPVAAVTAATPVVSGGLDGLPMALVVLLFAVLMNDNAATIRSTAVRMLTLNDENERLIERLRAADAAKSNFLANMSHELRTPLNAILGFSEVMRDEMMGKHAVAAYRGYAGDIHASGTHLLGLVDGILDLAKIESGRWDIEPAPTDLHGAADDVLRLYRLVASKAGVTMINDVPPGFTVLYDPRAGKQVALNLISNAVKFTPPGGEVRVRTGIDAHGWPFIEVADTGCGIRPEDRDRVFEGFGQGRHDIAPMQKGTGLGLAIVKGLLELHGGRVELESELGKGTIVRCLLPPQALVSAGADTQKAA
jgi:two-component system cell cycle sensor histidine kinase PleC